MPPDHHIRELLGRLRRQARWHEAALALAATTAALAGVVAVGALLGLWLGGAAVVSSVVPFARVLVVAMVLCALIAFVRRRPRTVFASDRLPSLLALEQSGQRSAVLTAAQFLHHAAPRRGRGSSELVGAHLAQTASALDQRHCDERLRNHFQKLDRRAGGALGATLALLLAAGVIAPNELGRVVGGLWGSGDAELSAVPLVGDLSLTLRPPAYVGAPPREVRGGDGTIRALKGTSVLLRATAERSVRAAELHVGGDGAPVRIVPLAVQAGRELVGELVVQQNERYRFVLKPTLGGAIKEQKGHPIFADQDKHPTIELREPAHDLELKESGRVMIKYGADDDYAVSELSLVYKIGSGDEQRVALQLPEARTKLRGSYAFDLAPLRLKPGDAVVVQLEVKDNDTISGPKRAVSSSRRITIYSSEQHRRELLARLRGMVDALVDLLADELENPLVPGRDLPAYGHKALQVDERALGVAGELLEIGRSLRETDGDKNVRFSAATERSGQELRSAYTQKKVNDQGLARAATPSQSLVSLATRQKGDTVALLERAVIYFEDLRGLATLEELKAATRDLQAAQEQLKELLEKYQKTGDETLRTALEAEIQNVKRRLGEIMQKMAELRKGLPEEFVNKEAFARRDMQSIFDKIDEMLAQNRMDDLAKELERLDNLLKNMERNLDQAGEQFGGDRYAGLRRELQDFKDNLEAVEAAQKQVHDDTEQQEQRYREQVSRRLGESLDKLVKDSVQDLEDAQRALDQIKNAGPREHETRERGSARLNETRQALGSRDFLEARDMSRMAESDLLELASLLRSQLLPEALAPRGGDPTEKRQNNQAAQKAQQKLGEVIERLEKLFPDPNDVLSGKDRKALQQLRAKQQQIGQRARKLGEQMRSINGQAPMFNPESQGEMDGAAQLMDRAGGELGGNQAGRAKSSQASALAKLQKMKDALKRQGQGGEGGIPMPLDGMPQLGLGGDDPRNAEKVEIPSGEAFKVPPEFRRDILDAMKQGQPERFKKQVDDFYRELIK